VLYNFVGGKLGYNAWKCHNETPRIDNLNKQNVFFQKRGQEGKTDPVWGLVPGGG
jgi:hypothetical protein